MSTSSLSSQLLDYMDRIGTAGEIIAADWHTDETRTLQYAIIKVRVPLNAPFISGNYLQTLSKTQFGSLLGMKGCSEPVITVGDRAFTAPL
ncbi:hypothetical protein LIER_40701 [Lithospermum erythrorhizon]|uniref:Uncharacterized protein n=1 Tax=Lithospermum erythrorhizon TaxID=34254 RepID=A0AAV3QY75_LITER